MIFDERNALNQMLFLQINAGTATPTWLIDSALVMAQDLIFVLPVLLLSLWLWGGDTRRTAAFKALGVALFALGVNLAIGYFWPEPRPFMLGVGHTWLPHAADAAFPSDHMTVFMSIGLALWLAGLRGVGLAVLVAAGMVAWARVFLGVHFPLDMLGSVGVAAISTAVVLRGWRYGGGALQAVAVRLYHRLLARPIRAGWIRP